MSINFEAANMAGYNNPKIEVFKAVINDVNIFTSAPTKTEIYNSITRGSIPFVLLISPEGYMLCILGSLTGEPEKNLHLAFTSADIAVIYPENAELPVISTP